MTRACRGAVARLVALLVHGVARGCGYASGKRMDGVRYEEDQEGSHLTENCPGRRAGGSAERRCMRITAGSWDGFLPAFCPLNDRKEA